jgi:hypothetical protein
MTPDVDIELEVYVVVVDVDGPGDDVTVVPAGMSRSETLLLVEINLNSYEITAILYDHVVTNPHEWLLVSFNDACVQAVGFSFYQFTET